ncbi:MAG: EF-hand domain-containing protein, partial [Verrucomicrobiaceae bacterium]
MSDAKFASAARWLLLPLLASGAFAQDADPFASIDANKDGKLSRTEIPEQLRPHFPLVDANGDGFVTRAEFMKAIAGQAGLGPAAGGEVEHLKDIDYAGNGNPRQKL